MFHMMQNCDEFGVSTDFIAFDFGKMQAYKKTAVKALPAGGLKAQFKKLNVDDRTWHRGAPQG